MDYTQFRSICVLGGSFGSLFNDAGPEKLTRDLGLENILREYSSRPHRIKSSAVYVSDDSYVRLQHISF